MEFILNPWPWYIVGPLITLTMFLLLYFGNEFGVSSTLRTTCSAIGGKSVSSFFDFEWKKQVWNIVFVIGAIIGGTLSSIFLETEEPMLLAQDTVNSLQALGFSAIGENFLPESLFQFNGFNPKQWIYLLSGGLLIGFGARYAGGCTSGHAISGLSNLQIPSLIAVVGFFIGGLVMNFFILKYILPF